MRTEAGRDISVTDDAPNDGTGLMATVKFEIFVLRKVTTQTGLGFAPVVDNVQFNGFRFASSVEATAKVSEGALRLAEFSDQ